MNIPIEPACLPAETRSKHRQPHAMFAAISALILLSVIPTLTSCSGTSTAATTTSTTTTSTGSSGTPNAYTAVYKTLSWGSAATVTFPSACTMSVTTTGVPPYHDPYYLGPVSTAYPTQVASTPSGLKLAVTPYTPASIVAGSGTFNICPTKASTTTATNLGPIGMVTSGEFLYNAYEATQTPALGDNVSYTFTSNGTTYTASFIDQCNSHATPLTMGYTWHLHGVPTCVTATVDGASGPSHIIGIALDGFPVYGGRDINGNVIPVSQLDACNGITSATPEFPSGAYHYVLPIGVTNAQSSLGCYAGTVSATLMAKMDRLACRMRNAHTVDPKKEREWRMKMGM
jgi:hypothetical protein